MIAIAICVSFIAGKGVPDGTMLTDASADLLPLAVTNGKTMDMEHAELNHDGTLDLYIGTHMPSDFMLLG